MLQKVPKLIWTLSDSPDRHTGIRIPYGSNEGLLGPVTYGRKDIEQIYQLWNGR